MNTPGEYVAIQSNGVPPDKVKDFTTSDKAVKFFVRAEVREWENLERSCVGVGVCVWGGVGVWVCVRMHVCMCVCLFLLLASCLHYNDTV